MSFVLIMTLSCSKDEYTNTNPISNVENEDSTKSSSKDSTNQDRKNTTPYYSIKADTIFLGEYHTYADIFKPFYLKQSYFQSNPDCTLPDSIVQKEIAERNKSLKEKKVVQSKDGVLHIMFYDSGLKINEKVMPGLYLKTRFWKETDADKINLDSINNLWKQHVMSGLFWDNGDNTVNIVFRIDERDFDICFVSGIFDGSGSWRNSPAIFNYIERGKDLPTDYVYLWNYDRFNNRTYIAENGDVYKTFITAKKILELADFDNTVNNPQYKIDLSKTYPVVQLYKNGELYIEGIAPNYSEEFREEKTEGATSTIINFSFATKKNGLFYYGGYEWQGYSRFYIEKVDFSQKSSNADFTVVEKEYIRIISDSKPNGKGTGSMDDGHGNITNYNEGD